MSVTNYDVARAEIRERIVASRLPPLDCAFHQLLAQPTSNDMLVRDITQHVNLTLRLWYAIQDRLRPADLALDKHIQLIQAVQRTSRPARRLP